MVKRKSKSKNKLMTRDLAMRLVYDGWRCRTGSDGVDETGVSQWPRINQRSQDRVERSRETGWMSRSEEEEEEEEQSPDSAHNLL